MAPDRLDLPMEIKTVVLPNHQFPQFPQLPSYEIPTFDVRFCLLKYVSRI
jgi:hypothetical protein